MHSSSISRRRFLAQAAAAGVALRSLPSSGQSSAPTVAVQTKNGKLRGTRTEGTRAFFGIPFAEPPVGVSRYRAPVAKRPWTNEQDATRFAPQAMQGGDSGVSQSEDCLYLNVWAPEGAGPFPVFVWIHGGALMGGRSSDPMFDGTKFAQDGIVCITLAYRVGSFGFLDFGPLLGASYAGSANNGLLDVMMALEWVRTNAAAFGGDPDRVTIGGESAGAKLVDTLMGVPSARPLFQQMISESGGADRISSRPAAAEIARSFGEVWRKETGTDVSQLLTAPPETVIKVQEVFTHSWPRHFPYRPEVDGVLIPRLPVETISTGLTRNKRLLLGTNKNECAPFAGRPIASTPSASELANVPLTEFMEVYRHYGEVYPAMDHEMSHIQSLTAEEYWIPSMRVLDAHMKGGGAAWNYRLDFAEHSGKPPYYAYHSEDLALVWDKPRPNLENGAAESQLAKTVHAAWAAFIQGKTPAAPGLPMWPAYQSDTRPTMILDVESRVEHRPLEAEMRLWDGVL